MNIGIDVDGVLVNLEKYQLENGTKFFKQKYNLQVVKPKAYDIQEIFGCTRPQREEFWRKYIWKYCLCEPMTQDAAETVRILRKRGHKVYVITGRVHTTDEGVLGILFRLMLRFWLWKNRFHYDGIVFCSEDESANDKVKACMDKKIDIMVDDKPENLFALKEQVKILCYPAAWNEECMELNECRIGEFEEMLKVVEEA